MSSLSEILVRMMVRGMLDMGGFIGLTFSVLWPMSWIFGISLLEIPPGFLFGLATAIIAFIMARLSTRITDKLLPSLEEESTGETEPL